MAEQPNVLRPLDALGEVWRDGGLPTPDRAVLTVLVLHADVGGRCWPSLSRIAANTGLGRSTVARVLDELERRGLVTRTRRPGRTSTLYTVHIATGSPGAGLVPERDYSRSGTKVVPERDSGSPGAGLELSIELPMELPIPTGGAAPAAPAAWGKRSSSRKQSPKTAQPDPHAEETQAIAVHLDGLLKADGEPGLGTRRWGAVRRSATQLLADGHAAADVLTALTWGYASDYWRSRLKDAPAKWLSAVRADWSERDRRPAGNGRSRLAGHGPAPATERVRNRAWVGEDVAQAADDRYGIEGVSR